MSTPIKSKNYNLIGYSGTEIPTFLSDMTDNNDIIDSELKRLSDVVNNAESLADTVNEHTEILKVYGNRIGSLEESVSALQPENIENGGLNYVKIRVGGDATANTKVRLYDVWLS